MRPSLVSNLGIRGKVFAGFAILVVPFIALAAVTWFMTRLISDDAAETREQSLPVLAAFESVRTAGLRVIETTNSYALINAIGVDGQSRFASFSLGKKREMQEAREEFEQAFTDLAELTAAGGDAENVKGNVAFAHRNILKQSDRIERMVMSGGTPADLLQIRERFETSAVNFRNLIQQAIEVEKSKLAAHQTALNDKIQDALLIVLGLSALGLSLAMVGAYVISARIARPIRVLRDATVRIGGGDFGATPARTSNDEVGELVDAFRSMAQRLETDIRAREASEAKFKSLVSNLPGAVYRCLWDKDWTEIFLSDPIQDIVGHPASDFIGNRVRSFASVTHPDDRQLCEDYVAAAAAKRGPFSGEFRVIHRDGSIRWVFERGQVVYSDDGAPLYLEGVLFDITERKHAELELERAHKELKVATQRLAAQERLSTMGRLTATVSHELRNPLAAIRTSLGTVRELNAGKDNGVSRALDRCDRNIARCAAIIDELLDYTRTRELQREATSIDPWLTETLDEHSAPRDVVLIRDFSAAGEVAIDRARFRQVVVNLIENAGQALNDASFRPAPGHERRITVRTELAGPHVKLSVVDSGPGIPPDVLPRIFEPLFTTKSFGVGLGLPLVRQIVEQHGGTIDVESSIGEGTAISIWLPRAPAQNTDRRMPAADANAA